MPSLIDTALNDGSGGSTTIQTADGLSIVENCLIYVFAKHEGGSGQTMTCDLGAGTTQFSTANAQVDSIGGALSAKSFYFRATASGTVNPRVVFSGSVAFRGIRAASFLPDEKKIFVLGNVDSDVDETGSSTAATTGPASSVTAGVAVSGLGFFGSRTITPGSGWAEVAEFNISGTSHVMHRFPAGVESITADATISAGVEWIDMLAIFDQDTAPPVRIPFRGKFGRSRTRYGF